MMNFVPLKITTEYTLLNSTIKIDNLISFLQTNQISSCAICDTNLYGVMEFYHKMTQNNLKPIIGLNINLDNNSIYLYPKNNQGYLNLLKIHTLKELKKLTLEELKSHLKEIKIVLPFPSYDLLEEFPNAYLGYQNDTEKIAALLKTEKIVYIRDVKVLKKEDSEYLKYLEAIKDGVLLNNVISKDQDYYLTLNIKEEDQKSTLAFISDIDVKIENNKRYIPVYDQNVDSKEYIHSLTKKGLYKRLKGNIPKIYEERLNHELTIIEKMGFVDYFLIVYDYVLYAKKNNILVGPGRGSAAGSLVSYCLGITNVDPMEYHLSFERFLNPDRVTMPDIDIDFEYTKRGLVIDYVRTRYGKMNVAPIMTFGTLGAKQVIRDIGRILDIPMNLIDMLAKFMDPKLSLKENLANEKIKELLNNYKELKKVYQDAFHLEGLKRHISTHAAGVVISSVSLDEVIPISYNGEIIMTGVTMEYLEDLGLLKMDFLALRNLTIIANVLDLIKENTGKVLDLNKINLNDPAIFELFSKGDTEGIFQYESNGMRNLMLKMHPNSFSDLVAAVALFRPGSMNNIDLFIARKQGRVQTSYLHPDLEPILKETYGVIVYQEQVMQILVKIGGYTYAEADNIRRAMSKKKESVMLKDKEHFLTNASKLGYEQKVSEAIYDLILKFANYGFNKAHSVSYALIGYQMAYLKVKFPIYFIANLLNMSIGSEIKTKEYIGEAKRKGITVLKPDINESMNTYLIKDHSLLLPFSSIKNLGINASNSIIEERNLHGKYQNYLEFVARVYGKSVNKKTILSLIDAGVFDTFHDTKSTLCENIDIAINYASLLNGIDENYLLAPSITPKEEYSEEILREKEYASFGFYVTNHPVSKYNDKNIVKIENITKYFDKHIQCVVLIEKIKSIKTKKGDNMAFITASDETGTGEFVVFPAAYYMLNNIHINDIIRIQGRVTKRFDSYQTNIDVLNKI